MLQVLREAWENVVLPQKLGHRFCEILPELPLYFCPILLGLSELLWHSIPQAAMGAFVVRHLPPLLKLGTRLGERQKPMLIQAFLAEARGGSRPFQYMGNHLL